MFCFVSFFYWTWLTLPISVISIQNQEIEQRIHRELNQLLQLQGLQLDRLEQDQNRLEQNIRNTEARLRRQELIMERTNRLIEQIARRSEGSEHEGDNINESDVEPRPEPEADGEPEVHPEEDH